MYCNQCGAPLNTGQPVCPTCGRPAALPQRTAGATPSPDEGRVARHRKLLGALWIIRGVILLPGGLFLWLGLSHASWAAHIAVTPGAYWSMGMMAPFFGALGLGVLIVGALSIVAGIGLLQPRSWARILTIVLGILDLVSIPFGTALGIYTLWVLLPETSESEFRHLAHAGELRPGA